MTLIQYDTFNGKKLYHRRFELGLNLQQVAALTGLSANFIRYLEQGKRHPSAGSIKLLCVALQVTPTYFFESSIK